MKTLTSNRTLTDTNSILCQFSLIVQKEITNIHEQFSKHTFYNKKQFKSCISAQSELISNSICRKPPCIKKGRRFISRSSTTTDRGQKDVKVAKQTRDIHG